MKSSIQLAKTRLGTDCGSDHELLKVWKPLAFECVDHNKLWKIIIVIHIPYDYTVEVTNRFKGLDMVDVVPEELWMEVHDIIQEVVIKTIPKKK